MRSSKNKDITLWCFGRDETTSKRPHSPDQESQSQKVPRSSHDDYTKKMTEVEDIELKLREKHDGNYTEEQLRAWAHLIQMKKHSSMDVPPDKPFWRGFKKRTQPATCTCTCHSRKTAAAWSWTSWSTTFSWETCPNVGSVC